MPAHLISVSSQSSGAGKSLVSAALCRWIRREHHAVTAFALTAGEPAEPRSLEVLAAAAELVERQAPAGPELALDELLPLWDYVVVDCAQGVQRPSGTHFELLNHAGSGIELLDASSGEILRAKWYQADALFPGIPPEIAELPEWTIQNAPRTGVISLPHLRNFADFRLIRASEWISSPPPGFFHILFVPATSDENFDRAWLRDTGLDQWIATQRSMGSRIFCAGSRLVPGDALEEGDLQDFRAASLALGRRLQPPEPDETALDRLAHWLERLAGRERLRERCLGS